MEANNLSRQDHNVLVTLSNLPQRIVSVHGRDNLAEFVMSDLCGPMCFNVKRAAYFVDNNDFNCCKGVAGYSADQQFDQNMWQNPEPFSEFMKRQEFNNRVRNLDCASALGHDDKKLMQTLAQQLGVENPLFYQWDLKHGNKGIFIFEPNTQQQPEVTAYLHGLYLLSFCPIH